jgi:non-heme chloroperoxidase
MMPICATRDATQIFYKDWGIGRPVVFSHGWPLNADAWDDQAVFMASHGFRAIAHDRRGHGRSSHPWEGNDMDHYADDLADLIEALDLHDAILIGHGAGGGEVVRYIGRHGTSRATKAVLIAAVPPQMLQTAENPGGLPLSAFDDIREAIVTDRSQFYKDLSTSFYGANRPGSAISEGVLGAFWLMSMQVNLKAAYECVKQFSESNFNEDLKAMQIPTLVVHGDDDQIVPMDDASRLAAQIIPGAEFKIYRGAPHGLPQTHKQQLNDDLLEFASH